MAGIPESAEQFTVGTDDESHVVQRHKTPRLVGVGGYSAGSEGAGEVSVTSSGGAQSVMRTRAVQPFGVFAPSVSNGAPIQPPAQLADGQMGTSCTLPSPQTIGSPIDHRHPLP